MDIHLLDKQGMSSLALIGTSAYQKDPLALSNTQLLLFATSSLFWLGAFAINNGWNISNADKFLLIIGLAIAVNISEFAFFITNLNKTWKKALGCIFFLGLGILPPFNVAFQAWRTYNYRIKKLLEQRWLSQLDRNPQCCCT